MKIYRDVEYYRSVWPENGHTAVKCPKCDNDITFYDDPYNEPYRNYENMSDTFYNEGGDAVYCCDHCEGHGLSFDWDCHHEEYSSFDKYIEDFKLEGK